MSFPKRGCLYCSGEVGAYRCLVRQVLCLRREAALSTIERRISQAEKCERGVVVELKSGVERFSWFGNRRVEARGFRVHLDWMS